MTYTFISHWMAGVQVIWFSVLVTCIYANVTILKHFFIIFCQYAHVFCYVWYIIDQQFVDVYFHQSLNGRRACYLIFSAGYMHMCKCNNSAAYSHNFQPMCTRFLYTTVECACGTLQTNRQIKSNCLIWRPCKWFTLQCYVVMSWILTTVRQFSTTSGPHWNVSHTDKDNRCGTL